MNEGRATGRLEKRYRQESSKLVGDSYKRKHMVTE